MTFGVQDFHDLVRLLEQHPEWRAELRRLVLTEELLELPVLMRQLTARVDQLTQRVDQLTARVDQLTARVDQLAEAQIRTEQRLTALAERVDQLAEAQIRTEAVLQSIAKSQDRMSDRIGEMQGQLLELHYRNHVGGYFGRLLRRVRVVRQDELDRLLEEGVTAGTLDQEAAREIWLADLIVRGRRQDGDDQTYVAVEVSVGIGPDDVARAARRASLLRRLRPALAVVAGHWITAEAEAQARASGVWQMIDGRVEAPDSA